MLGGADLLLEAAHPEGKPVVFFHQDLDVIHVLL
jgi:hypothetical protein